MPGRIKNDSNPNEEGLDSEMTLRQRLQGKDGIGATRSLMRCLLQVCGCIGNWYRYAILSMKKFGGRLMHQHGDNTARLCLRNGIHKVQTNSAYYDIRRPDRGLKLKCIENDDEGYKSTGGGHSVSHGMSFRPGQPIPTSVSTFPPLLPPLSQRAHLSPSFSLLLHSRSFLTHMVECIMVPRARAALSFRDWCDLSRFFSVEAAA
jgi:hypothetical protein